MTTDYSREIYDKYYANDKILAITLKDNTVIQGKLVGFFHGDTDSGEFFVEKWHFVAEKKSQAYEEGLSISLESSQDIDRIIDQKDIKNVRFKG